MMTGPNSRPAAIRDSLKRPIAVVKWLGCIVAKIGKNKKGDRRPQCDGKIDMQEQTTRWYHFIAWFFGGAFLANTIPHLVSGISGSPFQSPFASPPGQGLTCYFGPGGTASFSRGVRL